MKNKDSRSWHKNFKNYTEFIYNNPNYKGLFIDRSKDGKLNWVVAGKSQKGIMRREWWDKKCIENNIEIKPGCYAEIAYIIHPTKLHVCQICGKSLSIKYIYPNKRLINILHKVYNKKYEPYKNNIYEILEDISNKSNFLEIVDIFKLQNIKNNTTKDKILKTIETEHIITKNKTLLSPGVMSNSPDRFDGFHSDGNCCRSDSDKGRHKENLMRYGQDRRAYENWSDGDWKQADRLMSEFSKHKVSPDHIGPISLGFCHRPKFQPMTKKENSTKNNRMTLKDVKLLIEDEKNGDNVVSWHSIYIWNKLKNLVESEKDAIKLSKMMRENMHFVLNLFSLIYENNHKDYLKRFLHPEYSFYDYKFEGFDKKTGTYLKVIKIKKEGKNQKNNVDRYERIAFDSLKEYTKIENRRVSYEIDTDLKDKITKLLNLIENKEYIKADEDLKNILKQKAQIIYSEWK